eukprot:TRINITY_DN80363_c0_g1_i1.p1 TRINITY_DN80363_c0_g1~~TRINITY_DN80363_c0_g1_i1.p1  ORF type:complete len:198 (-),score=27.30 TRINITY_DN80363_c0_g1_i1:165-758(-)
MDETCVLRLELDDIIKCLASELLRELLRHAKDLMALCLVEAESNAKGSVMLQTEEPRYSASEDVAKQFTKSGNNLSAPRYKSAKLGFSAASAKFNGCAWPNSISSSRPMSARSSVRPLGQPLAGRIENRLWWSGAAVQNHQHHGPLLPNPLLPESAKSASRQQRKRNDASCTERKEPADVGDQSCGPAVLRLDRLTQ